MAGILAINIESKLNKAQYILADKTSNRGIQVLSFGYLPLQTDSTGSENDKSVQPEEHLVSPFSNLDFDSVVGVIDSNRVIYKTISLPFNDPKKIDQVAPLQIQDSLPFDTENFISDYVCLDANKDEEYNILCSLVPSEDIETTLANCSKIGVDPKILSSKAQAISLLKSYIPQDSKYNSFALIHISEDICSLAIFCNNTLSHLRELPLEVCQSTPVQKIPKSFYSNLLSSIVKVEQQLEQKIDQIFLIATNSVFEEFKQTLSLPVKLLPLETFIYNQAESLTDLNQISWALGLIALEFNKKSSYRKFIDFRKNKFAYKAAWRNLWIALQNELVYIVLAIVCSITALFSYLYLGQQSLSEVNKKIEELIKSAAPDESVPYKGEISFMENRIGEIESQLRDMGSLSTLSPLDSIKELFSAISSDVHLELESLSIGHERIDFRGSVPDNPSWGKLSELIQKAGEDKGTKKFCTVNITPMGKTPTSRVKISAEIKLCE